MEEGGQRIHPLAKNGALDLLQNEMPRKFYMIVTGRAAGAFVDQAVDWL
jgi:hypothetical protein